MSKNNKETKQTNEVGLITQDIIINCDCGNSIKFSINDKWIINIVGILQVKCKVCNKLYNTNGLL